MARLIATRGPGLGCESLTDELASSRALNADSTRELLGALEAEGLICGSAELDLTAAGQTLYRSLREYIAVPTARLLGQFDAGDIQTTMRTLQAIAERATQELAVAS